MVDSLKNACFVMSRAVSCALLRRAHALQGLLHNLNRAFVFVMLCAVTIFNRALAFVMSRRACIMTNTQRSLVSWFVNHSPVGNCAATSHRWLSLDVDTV